MLATDMDALTYKVIHLAGVMLLFLGLGISLSPGGNRKIGSALHGTALIVLIVAGFGMVAKLKTGFSGWVIAKLVVWTLFAILPVLVKRKVLPAPAAWGLAVILGVAAAYLGIYKSF